MILDTNIRSLEVVLAGAVTTNELPIFVSFIVGILPSSLQRKSQASITTGTTTVTILNAPSNKESKTVTFISVRNADTVAATVTIKFDDNAVETVIVEVILDPDDVLIFTEEEGFKVITSSGSIKSGQTVADASETVKGIAELATQAETDAGSDDARIVTPLKLATTTVAGIDSTAIHDNVSGEINAIADKATPVGADLVVIEDSAATFAKKKVSITNLPGGSPSFGVPTGNIDIGDSAVEGASGDATRADHQHAFTAPSAGYPQDVAPVEADGAATTTARSDHVHKNMDIGARVTKAALQTITSGSSTAVIFDTERYDTDTIHDNSTNNTRLTATTAGKYVITGHVRWEAVNTTGHRQLVIRVNGTTAIACVRDISPDGTLNTHQSITTIWDLAATDYVELMALHTATVDVDVTKLGDQSPEFAMQKIG